MTTLALVLQRGTNIKHSKWRLSLLRTVVTRVADLVRILFYSWKLSDILWFCDELFSRAPHGKYEVHAVIMTTGLITWE